MNFVTSLAFILPLTPGKTEERRRWGEEILGPRRNEYHAFRRRLGLTAQRMYLQHTPQGETAIIYLEGDDLQQAFRVLGESQEPFAIWFRQRAKDLFNGFDLTETSPVSLSKLIFNGPGVEEDEASYQAQEVMKRLGVISP